MTDVMSRRGFGNRTAVVGWILRLSGRVVSIGSWFERAFRFQTRSESIRPFKPKFLSADWFAAVAPSLRSFGPATVARSCSSSARFGKAHRATHARARKAHPANPRGLRTREVSSGAAVVRTRRAPSPTLGARARARPRRVRRARGARVLALTRRGSAPADPARGAPRRAFGVRGGARETSAPTPRTRRAPRGGRASGASPHASPTARRRRARDHVRFARGAFHPFSDRWRRLTRPSPVPRAGRTRAWRPSAPRNPRSGAMADKAARDIQALNLGRGDDADRRDQVRRALALGSVFLREREADRAEATSERAEKRPLREQSIRNESIGCFPEFCVLSQKRDVFLRGGGKAPPSHPPPPRSDDGSRTLPSRVL